MNIISKSKIWLTVSSALVILSIAFLAVFGFKYGIDFTGGSLLEVGYLNERPRIDSIRQAVNELEIGDASIQMGGENNVFLRFQEVSEKKHQEILQKLDEIGDEKIADAEESEDKKDSVGITVEQEGEVSIEEIAMGKSIVLNNIEELRFESVGPSIGEELKIKSLYAIVIVLILIVAYIAWSFRRVSKPVASWKYGLAAIVALFHDVMIVLGVFALLGKFAGVEIDTAFVAAILTVLGYSVNDTIVVFDRIRENLPKSEDTFAGTVNTSLNQTIGRSINTSLTTLLVLLSIFFFGGETIKYFVLALTIGIVAGTYSSIFLASPLLVVWEKLKK
ncbi:MAG: protein translocase subunit SecF [Patescibacteria group bacterium]